MNKSIIDYTYTVIDLETTGISKFDRVCEIGMVKIMNNEIVATFDTLIHPEVHIANTIFHGIEDWMVKDAPRFMDIACKVADFIKGSVLIAHNAPFDMRFIRYEFQRLNTDLSHYALCTLKMARRLHPGFPSHRLECMLREYDIINEHHHRAITDAKCSAHLFIQMVDRLAAEGIEHMVSLKKWGLPYDHHWCKETTVDNSNYEGQLMTRDDV